MKKYRKQWFSGLLAASVLFSALPVNALAVEIQNAGGLCEHHPEHTSTCEYVNDVLGTPCNHEHTEECYTVKTDCTHEHTTECYPQDSVSGNDDTQSDAEEKEPTACTHECSDESGCIKRELNCQHQHDGDCGYTQGTPGSPCTYVCAICKGQDDKQEEIECTCTTLCSDEAINEDCPLCGVKDADLSQCTGNEAELDTNTDTEDDTGISNDDEIDNSEELNKLFLEELADGDSVTVSTSAEFEKALAKGVDEIIVNGVITITSGTGSDMDLNPIKFPAGITIDGKGSGNLVIRSPIQIDGDDVTFKDIEMNFISSDALGGIPHREIFLAGHTLTLDNVNCYTDGASGSLGGFGSSEDELLPTVYAGGYHGTTINENGAELNIINSNDKTNIKAIYAGHDEGKFNMVPYYGDIKLNIDGKTSVREGIFSKENTGKVTININGKNLASSRIKYFEGNANTDILFDGISAQKVEVNGINNIKLVNGSTFEPISKSEASINNIEVPTGTVLNLISMPGTTIAGNFKGGGTLILDKDDSLVIKGEISGNTTFKTWGGSLGLVGNLIDGKSYITSVSGNISGTIKLDAGYNSNYSLEFAQNRWMAKNNTPSHDRELGSFKIISAPSFADFEVLEKEALDSKIEKSYVFVTESKDINDEVYVPELYGYVLREEDINNLDETQWGTDIFLMESDDWNGEYFLQFGTENSNISSKIKPGKYIVLFLAEEPADPNNVTVGELLKASIGSEKITIYKNEGQATKEIKAENIDIIPNQKFTGKEIKPKVKVVVDGNELSEGNDYIVKYEKNINVTTGENKAKAIVEGIGSYSGSVEVRFDIVRGETQTSGAVSAEKNRMNMVKL